MTYIPYKPPSFLDELKVLNERIDGKKTWISKNGKRLFQWDSQHGDIEMYSAKSKKHLGSLDCKGNPTKPAVKGRRL